MNSSIGPNKFTFATLMCMTCLGLNLVSAGDRVAIKAFATDEYTIERARDESKKVQTYHIMEGKYFPGNTDRPSMEEVGFMDIAQDLSHNLKKNKFFSETNQAKGDLLIMVHYGVTDHQADFMEMFSIDSIDDFGFQTENDDELFEASYREAFQADVFNMQTVNESNAQQLGHTARLLGMEEIFSSGATDMQVHEMRAMLEQERFFIVLQAFDLPLYRKGEKKVVWSTRYSMSAKGKDFGQSIAEMNFVAGEYFGQNRKGINLKRSTDDSDVKIGEVEVIDVPTN
ncbi:hypothetical protein F7C95_19160 [Opitutia bacterium ISCC 51]|nr:hypothetical protein F7C95_19160 [Opitutae bacterium ISCC 51]QXD28073.1 hypothetical protein GA003_19065 [Opitutae bacterium ISCC 52]